ncbi:MAG TPA: hypothetical protein VFB36_10795 [Nevskiaceae bacterium]|nr:hypothetical protein [Nevskiaceae bacterium]
MLEKEVLENDALSAWLREALRLALAVDPVQAANDAQFLACVLQARAMRRDERSLSLLADQR